MIRCGCSAASGSSGNCATTAARRRSTCASKAPPRRCRGCAAVAPTSPPAGRRRSSPRAPRSKRSSSARPCAKPGWSSCASAPRPACTCCACCAPPVCPTRASRSGSPRARSCSRPTAVLDDEGREWWDMVEGRIPDGGRLPAAIRARLAAGGHAADRSARGHRAARVAVVGGRPLRAAGVRAFDVVAGAHGVRVLGRRAWLVGRSAADGAGVHRGPARVVPLRTVTGERDVGRDRSADGAPRLPRAGTARLRRACRTRASGPSRIGPCSSI